MAVDSKVPKLWEHVGNSVPCMDHQGRIGGPHFDVYANWSPDCVTQPPNVYITSVAVPFSLCLHLHPADARELALSLLKACDLADATQVALDAEETTLEEDS